MRSIGDAESGVYLSPGGEGGCVGGGGRGRGRGRGQRVVIDRCSGRQTSI